MAEDESSRRRSRSTSAAGAASHGRPAPGLQASHQVRHRDQEDHQGDGDDRRLAHRQGAAQVAASSPYATRAHPCGHGGGDRFEHQAPADRPSGRDPTRAAVAAHHERPRSGRRLLLQRHQGGGAAHRAAARARARRSCRTSSAARVWPTTASATARSRSPGPASPTARRTPTPRRSRTPLIEAFLRRHGEGGVDELHIVYTEFVSHDDADARSTRRLLPLETRGDGRGVEPEGGSCPLYDFEPSAEAVLDALLPRYVESRDLQRAAAGRRFRARGPPPGDEVGDRQRRQSSSSRYTRLANAARQADITQEISEIVGGADALADATAGSE